MFCVGSVVRVSRLPIGHIGSLVDLVLLKTTDGLSPAFVAWDSSPKHPNNSLKSMFTNAVLGSLSVLAPPAKLSYVLTSPRWVAARDFFALKPLISSRAF